MDEKRKRLLTVEEQEELTKAILHLNEGDTSDVSDEAAITFIPDFGPGTLEGIEDFDRMRDEIHVSFPEVSLKQVREYLTGIGDLPDSMKPVVEEMNQLRKDCIEYQMSWAKDFAEADGIEIPQEYLTGDALDVFFAPETYRFFDFTVYYHFSWYEPWEMIELLSGPLFSM